MAKALATLGKVDRAIEMFESAKTLGADPADVELRLGNLYRDNGELARAERAFRSALEREPNSAEAMTGLGELLVLRREYQDARELLEQSVALNQGQLKAHSLLGKIGMETQNLDLATRHLMVEVRLNPQDPKVYNNLAWALMLKGDTNTAFRIADQGLQLKPNDLNLLDTLGHVLIGMEEGGRANAIFKDLLKQRPESPWVNLGLGLSYRLLGNEDEAKLYLAKAAEFSTGNDPYLTERLKAAGVNVAPDDADETEDEG